jgi:hypothetical protein
MWLMVEKLTFNYLATALVDIPAVSMSIAHSLNLRHLWHFFSGLLLSPAQGAPTLPLVEGHLGISLFLKENHFFLSIKITSN